MQLQKQLSKKVGSKEYAKWVIVLPPEKVSTLGWKAGEELEVDISDNKLVIRRKARSR